MQLELNPYNPGSGAQPMHLAGRDAEIAAFDLLIVRTKKHLQARPMVLSGLRGVGKTVLLRRLKGLADHHGWITIKLEARRGESAQQEARKVIAAELQSAARRLVPLLQAGDYVRKALSTVTSFTATAGVKGISLGVSVDPTRASTGHLEIDLKDLVEDLSTALKKQRSGFVIFIDEMQDLDDELLGALISAQHHANQEQLPFFVVGAGLPNLPGRLAEIRSYAERAFDYRIIGKLSPDATRDAFTQPAKSVGQHYSHEALELMIEASGMYPYFVQEFGSAMWESALKSPFTPDDADAAITLGREKLDAGFFVARWQRATKAERRFLHAMAQDGEGPSSTGDIASNMGKKPTALGPARATLIDKGLIYSPEYGHVAFTVPGMAGFIARQELLD
ncbi:AAA family ATPase (plasmid) [Micrococcaceae bacterium Sec5.7]